MIKQWYNRLMFSKIKTRITVNFTLLMSISMLFIILVINLLTSRALLNQVTISNEKDLELYSAEIDQSFQEIYSLQYQLISDKVIQSVMSDSIETISSESDTTSSNSNSINLDSNNIDLQNFDIDSYLNDYASNYPMVNGVFLFNDKGDILNTNYQVSPYNKLIENYDELHVFLDSDTRSAFSTPTLFPLNPAIHDIESASNVSYFSQYIDLNTLDKVGYLLISVKENWLFNSFTSESIGNFDAIAIIDENGNEIFYTEKNNTASPISFETLKEKHEVGFFLKEGDYISFETTFSNYDHWKIVAIMPQDIVISQTHPISLNIIIIAIVTLLFMFVFNVWISNKITEPINKVMKAFKTFEQEEWPDPIDHIARDETQQLTDSVNSLFVYIQKLLKDIQHEHEENISLELDLLQAQINPHFIHNTMNALECIALEKDDEEIAKTIQAMNYLFRISMSLKQNTFSIKNEMECIENFAHIMAFRYPDKFDYEANITPTLYSYEIPKFLLQPLVENAIFHGILPLDQKGTVSIEGIDSDDTITFIVSDNGIGFNTDVSSDSTKEKAGKSSRGYGHIGLNNIRERLTLYYKNDFTFDTTSTPGQGTLIIIKIPKTIRRED